MKLEPSVVFAHLYTAGKTPAPAGIHDDNVWAALLRQYRRGHEASEQVNKSHCGYATRKALCSRISPTGVQASAARYRQLQCGHQVFLFPVKQSLSRCGSLMAA